MGDSALATEYERNLLKEIELLSRKKELLLQQKADKERGRAAWNGKTDKSISDLVTPRRRRRKHDMGAHDMGASRTAPLVVDMHLEDVEGEGETTSVSQGATSMHRKDYLSGVSHRGVFHNRLSSDLPDSTLHASLKQNKTISQIDRPPGLKKATRFAERSSAVPTPVEIPSEPRLVSGIVREAVAVAAEVLSPKHTPRSRRRKRNVLTPHESPRRNLSVPSKGSIGSEDVPFEFDIEVDNDAGVMAVGPAEGVSNFVRDGSGELEVPLSPVPPSVKRHLDRIRKRLAFGRLRSLWDAGKEQDLWTMISWEEWHGVPRSIAIIRTGELPATPSVSIPFGACGVLCHAIFEFLLTRVRTCAKEKAQATWLLRRVQRHFKLRTILYALYNVKRNAEDCRLMAIRRLMDVAPYARLRLSLVQWRGVVIRHNAIRQGLARLVRERAFRRAHDTLIGWWEIIEVARFLRHRSARLLRECFVEWSRLTSDASRREKQVDDLLVDRLTNFSRTVLMTWSRYTKGTSALKHEACEKLQRFSFDFRCRYTLEKLRLFTVNMRERMFLLRRQAGLFANKMRLRRTWRFWKSIVDRKVTTVKKIRRCQLRHFFAMWLSALPVFAEENARALQAVRHWRSCALRAAFTKWEYILEDFFARVEVAFRWYARVLQKRVMRDLRFVVHLRVFCREQLQLWRGHVRKRLAARQVAMDLLCGVSDMHTCRRAWEGWMSYVSVRSSMRREFYARHWAAEDHYTRKLLSNVIQMWWDWLCYQRRLRIAASKYLASVSRKVHVIFVTWRRLATTRVRARRKGRVLKSRCRKRQLRLHWKKWREIWNRREKQHGRIAIAKELNHLRLMRRAWRRWVGWLAHERSERESIRRALGLYVANLCGPCLRGWQRLCVGARFHRRKVLSLALRAWVKYTSAHPLTTMKTLRADHHWRLSLLDRVFYEWVGVKEESLATALRLQAVETRMEHHTRAIGLHCLMAWYRRVMPIVYKKRAKADKANLNRIRNKCAKAIPRWLAICAHEKAALSAHARCSLCRRVWRGWADFVTLQGARRRMACGIIARLWKSVYTLHIALTFRAVWYGWRMAATLRVQQRKGAAADQYYAEVLLDRCLFEWKAFVAPLRRRNGIRDAQAKIQRMRSLCRRALGGWRQIVSLHCSQLHVNHVAALRIVFSVWRSNARALSRSKSACTAPEPLQSTATTARRVGTVEFLPHDNELTVTPTGSGGVPIEGHGADNGESIRAQRDKQAIDTTECVAAAEGLASDSSILSTLDPPNDLDGVMDGPKPALFSSAVPFSGMSGRVCRINGDEERQIEPLVVASDSLRDPGTNQDMVLTSRAKVSACVVSADTAAVSSEEALTGVPDTTMESGVHVSGEEANIPLSETAALAARLKGFDVDREREPSNRDDGHLYPRMDASRDACHRNDLHESTCDASINRTGSGPSNFHVAGLSVLNQTVKSPKAVVSSSSANSNLIDVQSDGGVRRGDSNEKPGHRQGSMEDTMLQQLEAAATQVGVRRRKMCALRAWLAETRISRHLRAHFARPVLSAWRARVQELRRCHVTLSYFHAQHQKRAFLSLWRKAAAQSQNMRTAHLHSNDYTCQKAFLALRRVFLAGKRTKAKDAIAERHFKSSLFHAWRRVTENILKDSKWQCARVFFRQWRRTVNSTTAQVVWFQYRMISRRALSCLYRHTCASRNEDKHLVHTWRARRCGKLFRYWQQRAADEKDRRRLESALDCVMSYARRHYNQGLQRKCVSGWREVASGTTDAQQHNTRKALQLLFTVWRQNARTARENAVQNMVITGRGWEVSPTRRARALLAERGEEPLLLPSSPPGAQDIEMSSESHHRDILSRENRSNTDRHEHNISIEHRFGSKGSEVSYVLGDLSGMRAESEQNAPSLQWHAVRAIMGVSSGMKTVSGEGSSLSTSLRAEEPQLAQALVPRNHHESPADASAAHVPSRWEDEEEARVELGVEYPRYRPDSILKRRRHEHRKKQRRRPSVLHPGDGACYIDILPDDVLLVIFSYLSKADVSRSISKVCLRWQGIAGDVFLWSSLAEDPYNKTTHKERAKTQLQSRFRSLPDAVRADVLGRLVGSSSRIPYLLTLLR